MKNTERNPRSRKLVIPYVNSTTYGLHSFRCTSANIWNKLTEDVRSSTSLNEFRTKICQISFKHQFNYILYTSSNQRLWEYVRRRLNFYTDTLNDFPSWLSTSKSQPFFINNRGFAERYFSDKVHAILMEEVPVQDTLRDGASFRRLTSLIGLKYLSAFKFRAKYSHINL